VLAILIIETSTEAASIALAVDGEIVVEKSFVSDRRHNALLFAPLAEIVEAHGSSSFDAVLVGSGPGSYSGTRVGIAAAQGAALVAGCKAVAVPSLLATAEALSGEPCLAFGDARRGSFWVAGMDGGELTREPSLTDRIGFESALGSANAAGTAVFCMDPIRGVGIPISRPTAAGLWQAWQASSPQSRAIWVGKTPQPIYLAPPHITPSKKEVFGNA
jgi:tRNA threonylcarbamoyladenosine biosynthesis protein TsaB